MGSEKKPDRGTVTIDEEQLEFPRAVATPPPKPWAITGTTGTRRNLITSIDLAPETLEQHVLALEQKYDRMRREAVLFEAYQTDDADLVAVGYGVVSRILKTAVDQARQLGWRVGWFRPRTLWPFPTEAIRALSKRAHGFLTVEGLSCFLAAIVWTRDARRHRPLSRPNQCPTDRLAASVAHDALRDLNQRALHAGMDFARTYCEALDKL